MPYFDGDPVPEIEQFKVLEKDGVNIKRISIGSHTGTHIDAPAHFIKGGMTVDKIQIGDISGVGTCVKYDPEGKLDLPSQHFDVLFLYTGYDLKWKEFSVFRNFPYINVEDAERIKDYGVKVVGIDSPSAEISNSKDFRTHKILLGNSIPIVENLNSSVLRNLVDKSFFVFIAPLAITGGDGSPARVFAVEV
jgi:arylformamidase